MTSPTYPRDADNRVLLTPAQAAALARLSTPEGRHDPEGMALLSDLWRQRIDTHPLLAEWIVRWAPVCEAVGRQLDESCLLTGEEPCEDMDAYLDACGATEAAFKAAMKGEVAP